MSRDDGRGRPVPDPQPGSASPSRRTPGRQPEAPSARDPQAQPLPSTGSPPGSPPAQSLWLRPERASRGPVPEYSRARIAVAAVQLADEGGLAAISMRRVAAALGTAAASLYRYVLNRDELLQLMVDTVTGELEHREPSGAGWLADLLALARQQRDLLRRHPWMLDLGHQAFALTPNTVDFLEHTLEVLAPLDVPAGTKLEAVAMMSGSVSLFVRDEQAREGARTTSAGQVATAEFLVRVVTDGRHPRLAQAFAAGPPGPVDPDELFDRMLSGILTGLLRPPTTGSPGAGAPGGNR